MQQAEEKWLKNLLLYCQGLFEKTKIPSHNHTHHLRVWGYSKEILNAVSNNTEISYELVEGALISSLFHDTGLTKTFNENHGKESRKISELYFSQNNIKKPGNLEEILKAIELHDDKDYKQNNTEPNSLLSIICNADDLDAFGNIGVVRYTEIYLLRGISTNELAKKVIQNLDKRFSNFERTYINFHELYERHKERYLVTKIFFESLQTETT